MRRLLVMVRHLPPGNPVDRVVHPTDAPDWGVLHQLVDDTRRCVMAALGVKDPVPHPLSPHANPSGSSLTPDRIAVLEAAAERAKEFNAR